VNSPEISFQHVSTHLQLILFNFAILLPYSSILFHLPEILMAPQGKNRHLFNLFQEKPIITLDESKPAWLAPDPPSRSPRPTAPGSPGSVRWEGPGKSLGSLREKIRAHSKLLAF
jgi:hypothetical protein